MTGGGKQGEKTYGLRLAITRTWCQAARERACKWVSSIIQITRKRIRRVELLSHLTPLASSSGGPDDEFDVRVAREAVAAVLVEREEHVVAFQYFGQLQGSRPENGRIAHSVEEAHRACHIDLALQEQVVLPIIEQLFGDAVRLLPDVGRVHDVSALVECLSLILR